MAVSGQLYAGTTLLTGLISLALGLYVTRFEEPVIDVRGLATYLLATGCSSTAFALFILASGTETMILLLNVTWTFIVVALLGFAHFGFALSGRLDRLTDRRMAGGIAVGALLLGTMWTDGWVHDTFRSSIEYYQEPFVTVNIIYGPVGLLFVAFTTFLIAIGTYLILRHLLRSESTYRRQGILVFIAVSLPWVGSMLTLVNWPSPAINLSPPAAAVSGILLTVAIVGYGFLDIVPLAYRQVVDSIDEYVVIVDQKDRVVELNEQATELLGEDCIGEDAHAVFPMVIPKFDTEQTVEQEVTLEQGGRQTVYTLRSKPLEGFDGRLIGRTITLQEVTELKNRERELDLLKQVLTRVLRHNIRNDLMVIQMQAEAIDSQEQSTSQRAETIVDTADDLFSTSEKARTIGDVLEFDDETVTFDARTVVDSVLAELRAEYPNVDWTVEVPESVTFEAHPMFEVALENVIENAAEHNTSDEPAVTITASDDQSVTLTVDDNGPGIPRNEQDVLENQAETALSHGSGVGLWLVDWIVGKSGGDLSIDAVNDGTTIQFSLVEATPQEAVADD